ncbi:ubiquitin-related domain-containing protein [Lineolata rhizophorae]|uniref:Ubiquitin-like modifier HUB1 n=1 Tax=Lineolata rhizophorae TaxID=578093 RepID=A0A6A6P4L9_9PEZI|nr:ubiquitin-related domain-containing protein [Lineolata rhizophorae]
MPSPNSRSRSPPRRRRDHANEDTRGDERAPSRRPRSMGGFRWKEKPRRDEDGGQNEQSERGSGSGGRGYYGRERERERERSPRRESDRYEERRQDGYRDRGAREDRRDRDRDRDRERRDRKERKEEKRKEKPVLTSGGEEMIRVTVNDRLGTKAQIPCFASDNIGDFKKLVAAQIGRKPHEIMLKRQGQRPFKDALSLADYEISNGVQLDLEIDTGD